MSEKANFKPNYKKKCMNCDVVPTVDIEPEETDEVIETRLCGTCTFGEADCIDPDNW